MSGPLGLSLAEGGMMPLPLLRLGIRRQLRDRLARCRAGEPVEHLVARLREAPVAIATASANAQHYELPPAFFAQVLGPHLKYSGAWWEAATATLGDAELAMLRRTAERAGLRNGQRILELGCGWGSLSLYLAAAYPDSEIVAVSNAAPQREYLAARAPANLTIVTADMNDFVPPGRFDRVVSVEMFEHMRNYEVLLRRIAECLTPEGELFVHVFCHRRFAYPFEVEGEDDWMARYFFTGGLMPSFGLFRHFDADLVVREDWWVPGTHYARTAEAWRHLLEARREAVMPILASVYGAEAPRWFHRWRLFFLACEELFAWRGGAEWGVGHYRFVRRAGQAGGAPR